MTYLLTVDMYQCGGVLIAPDVVLTAGHCDPRIGSTVIVAGYEYQTAKGGAKEVGVIDAIQHPDFNRWSMNYDFQLVRLDQSVNLKTDIILNLNEDDEAPFVGGSLTVIGMGQLEYQGELSYILNDVDVQYIPNAECDEMMAGKVWDSMLCGGVEGGGKDSCIGDSGGPILMRDGDNHTIVGLVSWGYRCALNGTAGVYSRVSVAMGWIKEVVCFTWQTEADFCPGPTPSPSVSLYPSLQPSSPPSATTQPSFAPSSGPSASPTTPKPTLHPSNSPSSTPTTLEWALRNCTDLELQFMTDYWPEETSFTLTQVDKAQNASNADVTVIWDVGTSRTSVLRASTEYYWYTCVDLGIANSTCVTLNFLDRVGDGLYNSAYIVVTWDGEVVFDKLNFGHGAILELGDGCDGEDGMAGGDGGGER
jgi:trypsin